MTSPASGLNVLDHGSIEVKANDDIAVRYVKSLFRDRRCEQAVELAPPKLANGKDLASESCALDITGLTTTDLDTSQSFALTKQNMRLLQE